MVEFEREVLDRLIRTEGKLDGLYELIEAIEHDLYGNGQPGISHRLTVAETKLSERTTPPKTATYGVPAGVSALAVIMWEVFKRKVGLPE